VARGVREYPRGTQRHLSRVLALRISTPSPPLYGERGWSRAGGVSHDSEMTHTAGPPTCEPLTSEYCRADRRRRGAGASDADVEQSGGIGDIAAGTPSPAVGARGGGGGTQRTAWGCPEVARVVSGHPHRRLPLRRRRGVTFTIFLHWYPSNAHSYTTRVTLETIWIFRFCRRRRQRGRPGGPAATARWRGGPWGRQRGRGSAAARSPAGSRGGSEVPPGVWWGSGVAYRRRRRGLPIPR
jgi:hypothetical protein